jgi:hypothetical protein
MQETAPPRITFLAAVRNLVMEPLVQHGGYTRVVFSNDIFIEAESIVELLDTKGGDYDMACGLDLSFWGCVYTVLLRRKSNFILFCSDYTTSKFFSSCL